MMHIFPYLREQINSGKTREEIYRILDSVTDSRKFIWFPNAEFSGKVSSFYFTIRPEFGYRNSFAPVLTGTMTEKKEGTMIDIVLQLHIFVRMFIVIWSGGLFLFFLFGVLGVYMDIIDGTGGIILILVPIGMITASQIIMRFGFYSSARKAQKRLRELIC